MKYWTRNYSGIAVKMASYLNNNNKRGNNLFEQNMEIAPLACLGQRFTSKICLFWSGLLAKLHFITNAEKTKKKSLI